MAQAVIGRRFKRNTPLSDGEILCSKCYEGKLEDVRSLLASGVDVNFVEGCSWTPLCYAAWAGEQEVVALLLASGADFNAACDGWPVLHRVAWNGYYNITRQLLDTGAKIDSLDSSGETPLHNAAGHYNPSIVQLLLDRGADPTVLSGEDQLASGCTDNPELQELLRNAEYLWNKGWSPETHSRYSDQQRHRIVTALLIWNRRNKGEESHFPLELQHLVCEFANS